MLLKFTISLMCMSGVAFAKAAPKTKTPTKAVETKSQSSHHVTFNSYVRQNMTHPAFKKRPLPQDAFKEAKRRTIPDTPEATPSVAPTPIQNGQPPPAPSTADPFAPSAADPFSPPPTTPTIPPAPPEGTLGN